MEGFAGLVVVARYHRLVELYVEGVSAFVELLMEAFPSWRELPVDCAVPKAFEVNQRDFADEVAVVTERGGRADLVARLARTHRDGRVHNGEWDDRLWDVMTEAEAFAWAAGHFRREVSFTDDSNKPDISVEPGWCVEAKTVWTSVQETRLLREMVDASDRGVLQVRVKSKFDDPHPTLLHKFENGLANALGKPRPAGARLVVFFHLTGIDFGTKRQEALGEIARWAKLNADSCGIVICWRGRWAEPWVTEGLP